MIVINLLKKILNKSEEYIKTDMTYLVKGGFWIFLSHFVQISTGVIVTIALANLLPKESLGTYQFILSIAAIISVLTLSGLGTAITKAVAGGHDGVLRSGVRTKLRWSIGIVLASGATALYYYLNENVVLAYSFLIVGIFAPFIESFKLYENYLYGKEAFRDSVTLGAWRKPLPLVALLVTVYLTNDVLTLIFVYFASNAISFLAVYLAVIRKYQPPEKEHVETITLSKHLSVLRIVGHIGNHVDKILIWHFLGSAAVASFAIAQLSTRYSGVFLNGASTLALPKVSKRDLPTLQQTLPRKVWLFTLMMFFGAIGYIIIAHFAFPLIFPQYPESIMVSQALALGFLFIPRFIYSQVLIAHNQIGAQYTIGFSHTIIKALLLYTLLPIYGIWGAVYAILVSEFIQTLIVRIFFNKAKV